jgi:hypothetical protein
MGCRDRARPTRDCPSAPSNAEVGSSKATTPTDSERLGSYLIASAPHVPLEDALSPVYRIIGLRWLGLPRDAGTGTWPSPQVEGAVLRS